MITKHTPGQWFVDESHANTGRHVVAAVDGSVDTVAAVRPQSQAEETEANARLIAAAPDLLQLLIDIRASKARLYELGEKADDLIAKATGN